MKPLVFAVLVLILPIMAGAMSLGTVSDDVKTLQETLNRLGYTVTNYGDETRYFGPATEAALTRYQIDHAIEILGGEGIMNGLGTADPLTLAHLMGNTSSYGRMNMASLLAAVSSSQTRTLTITLYGQGTVSTSQGQTCSVSPCVLTLPYKSRITLTATPTTGSSFTSWSGACSGTSRTCSLTMSRNRSVTATFSTVSTPPPTPTTYTLRTGVTGNGTISGTGITCPTDCSETYASGTSVTLTAAPFTGSTFEGWSGACSGTTCTVLMTQTRTVTASFNTITTPPPTTWTRIARENETFTLSTPTDVRYGASTTWTTPRTMSGTVSCSNSTFGDPLEGTVKECQVPEGTTPTLTPTNGTCGSSNGQTLTSAPTTNLCTTGTASSVTGSGPWYWSCAGSNGGTTAQCSALLGNTNPTPTTYTLTVTQPAGGTVFSSPAGIICNGDCSEAYISGTNVTLTATPQSGYAFSGWGGACSGTSVTCTLGMTTNRSVTASFIQVTPPPSGMPYVNRTLIPQAVTGNPNICIAPNATPVPRAGDGVGAWRTNCGFSHMNFDDAIVYPGQQGVAHLHTYFGNTGSNYTSTASSLVSSGNSTCTGGILNRTSYWVPAMIDTRDSRPLTPLPLAAYYKVGYTGPGNQAIQSFPQGLRMIAGNSRATTPQDTTVVHFQCHWNGGHGPISATIPGDCPAGSALYTNIEFPQCWNGINLDSADHKSHMSYPVNGQCPTTHPIAIPHITYNVVYPVSADGDTAHWRLSSDMNGVPPGTTNHGDWFAAWRGDPSVSNDYIPQVFVENVLNLGLDGGTSMLGDGRELGCQP